MKRSNLTEQQTDQSEGIVDEIEYNVVQDFGGYGSITFVLNAKIYSTSIDSESPITVFTQGDLRTISKTDVIFTLLLPKDETYVEVQTAELIGIHNSRRKCGNANYNVGQDSFARERKKSLIGRKWLSNLILGSRFKQRQ